MASPTQYGAYKYESAPARALGSLTSDSFDYKDQQKNLIQLNNAVGYMSAYMRKMQKGIDAANQNFIQQIQSLINDIIVLIGGGGDTGFDFGDLKYIFQMWGALFGFDTSSGIPLPINIVQAVWHMMSNYLFPNGNFTDLINMIIDNAIAGILDIFGDIPIVGQALQQLAVIISDIRDGLMPLISLVDNIMNALGGFSGAGPGDILGGIFNQLGDLINLDFSSPAAFIQGIIDAILAIPNFFAGLISGGILGTDSPLNGANIIGEIAQSLVAGLPSALSTLFENFTSLINGVVGGTGNPLSALISKLTDFGSWATSALTQINQIGDILNGLIVTPVTSAVQNVVDWFGRLLGFQNTTNSNIVNVQNFTISSINSGYRNPAWVCRYPNGDVTYPEILNMNTVTNGNTGAASTGTAHTHQLLPGSGTAGPALYGVGQNAARIAAIPASATTIWDTVGIVLNKDAGTLNNIYVELFREDAAGGTSRVSSVEVSGQVTTADVDTYVEVSITPVIVQAGERYWVKVRNASTTSTGLYVRTIVWRTANANACGYTGTKAHQTSYTSAEMNTMLLDANSLPLVWAIAAAKNLSTTDQSFSDDFNRAALGGFWSLVSNTGTNQAFISQNKVAFAGATDGNQNAIYIRSTAGNGMRVDGNLSGMGLAITGPRQGLLISCARDFSQVVFLGVNLNSAKIYSGPWNSLTERATVGTGGDGLWTIYYDVANNKYVALKEGNDVGLSWTDSGNVVSHNKDTRFGGIRLSRASFFNSGNIDNFTVRDWTA